MIVIERANNSTLLINDLIEVDVLSVGKNTAQVKVTDEMGYKYLADVECGASIAIDDEISIQVVTASYDNVTIKVVPKTQSKKVFLSERFGE